MSVSTKAGLQAVEDQHIRARLDSDSAAQSDSSSNSSDSEASSGSSDAELDPDLGADLDRQVDIAVLQGANRQRLNSSLLSMYSSPAATLPSFANASALEAQNPAEEIDAPAFAPLQVWFLIRMHCCKVES